MLKTIGILIIAAVMVISEVPPLVEQKQKKEVIIFSILLFLGIVLSILVALGVTVPNPLDFISYVLKPLTKLISK
ncbi:hypothetical protein [Psychrobacillus sp. BM2]|uniref:hypothetical protein n=1 Tax=Psychrobacillus sp. BM2 TaxID=3400421 RepID=UPI003B01AC8F